MRGVARLLQSSLPSQLTVVRQTSCGVDALRQLLQQHSQDVQRIDTLRDVASEKSPGHPHPTGIPGVGSRNAACSTSSSDSLEAVWSRGNDTAVLVKELLRIFTRKVPGGLVPDELVRGFMKAYRELGGAQERLAFLHLVIREMGLSVGEVNSAARVWTNLMARGPPSAAAGAGAAPSSSSAGPSPAVPASAASAASLEGFYEAAYRAADRLGSACRPLYTQLFLPISQAPEGMKFLVDLRADLLDLAAAHHHPNNHQLQEQHQQPPPPQPEQQQQGACSTSPAASAPLRAMADHLRQSLAEWFSVGLLHLQPISWQESPAALLERVMVYEAVHPLSGWEELRRRLGPRRRVFAFTHPSMPGEPLVVLHTALMEQPATRMNEILEEEKTQPGSGKSSTSPRSSPSCAPDGQGHPVWPAHGSWARPNAEQGWEPTVAVFYSISSSQPGLRGVELGHFLIKRVAEQLLAEHPSIRQLVTLSPLPNFRSWLVSRLRQEQEQHQQQQEQGAAARPQAHDAHLQGPQATNGAEEPPRVGGDDVDAGGASLLLPHEAAEVTRLARVLGWTGCVAGDAVGSAASAPQASGATTSATAAAALSWLLEGDRWLSAGGRQDCAAGTLSPPASVPIGGSGCAAKAAGRRLAAEAGADAQGALAAAAQAEGVLRPLLLRLATRYLAAEKRRRFALCPVAHFHLRNGASLWRLNWRADMSPLGLQRSFGIMVNYEYCLATVYDNNRKYLLQHEVQAHPQVLALLQHGSIAPS